MPRKAIEITLTKEQKAQLEKMTRSHSAERRMVERARIILACAPQASKTKRLQPNMKHLCFVSVNGAGALLKMALLGLQMSSDQVNRRPMEKHLGIYCFLSWKQLLLKAYPSGIVQLWRRNWRPVSMRFGGP